MTQATDIDLREIKDLIAAGNATTQKQIDRLFAITEANTKAIETITKATEGSTKAIETVTKATEGNTKAIADLTASFTGLREEVRVGFAEVKGEFKAFDEKMKSFDQRISTGEFAKRGITIGLTVTVVGGLLLTFGKILFFGKLI
jgi:formiminotetrahydrofolate cyclodeaminase